MTTASTLPTVGAPAPAFSVRTDADETLTLDALRGQVVVLYFYPKDDTSGCTREACDFRDEHSALEAAGAVVLGVSPDDTKSHMKFATKYSLPFPLLADTERKVCDAYGVWGEKSLYGRKFLGVTRATFVIDTEGKVAHVWPKVKVDGHVQEILQTLKGSAPGAGAVAAVKKAVTKKVAAAKKAVAAVKKTVAKKAAPAKKAVAKKSVARRK
ncbi:MAG TPA: thioredoxin-dependent thiol peroxidase [Myxococcaceae bacterium]|nr:thioredoxin-dependent thiol peroxidase [Myxococcaceae bacterium]